MCIYHYIHGTKWRCCILKHNTAPKNLVKGKKKIKVASYTVCKKWTFDLVHQNTVVATELLWRDFLKASWSSGCKNNVTASNIDVPYLFDFNALYSIAVVAYFMLGGGCRWFWKFLKISVRIIFFTRALEDEFWVKGRNFLFLKECYCC